jgi:hypothetical protein
MRVKQSRHLQIHSFMYPIELFWAMLFFLSFTKYAVFIVTNRMGIPIDNYI